MDTVGFPGGKAGRGWKKSRPAIKLMVQASFSCRLIFFFSLSLFRWGRE